MIEVLLTIFLVGVAQGAGQDPEDRAQALLEEARAAVFSSPTLARGIAEDCLAITEPAELWGLHSDCLRILGGSHYYGNTDLQAAEMAFLDAIAAAERIGDELRVAKLATNLGVLESERGDLEAAVSYHLRAAEAFRGTGEDESLGLTLNNLGQTFSQAGFHTIAIDYFERAIAALERAGTGYGVVVARSRIGTALQQTGAMPDARAAFEAAIAHPAFMDEPLYASDVLQDYARLLLADDDVAAAAQVAEDAVALVEEGGFAEDYPNPFLLLAEIRLDQGEVDAAAVLLRKARDMVEGEGLGSRRERILTLTARLAAARGDNAAAARAWAEAYDLAVSGGERDRMATIAIANARFSARERETRIAALERDALVRRLALDRARARLALALGSAGGLALLAFLALKAFRDQRRLARSRATFLAELHHRTQNNLQLVLSVFAVEARRHRENGDASPAYRDAANRLRAMSLVQDHLFRDRRAASIEGADFLSTLIDLLRESFAGEAVLIEQDLDPLPIDVTAAAPLGLLVGELITNAVKHAFGPDGGTVTVTLKANGATATLTVIDDGRGMADAEATAQAGRGLGMGLVDDLAEQLGGEVHITTGHHGTSVTIGPIRAAEPKRERRLGRV